MTDGTPWYKQLHWQVALAMIFGVLAGLVGGQALADKIGWIGQLFIKLLKMIIGPLVLTSIISGVASVGGGAGLGRLFGKTLGYYVLTSLLAVITGLILANTLQPGVGADITGAETHELPDLTVVTSPAQLILDIVPENIVEAASETKMLSVIFFSIVLGISISRLPGHHREPLLRLIGSAFEAMMRLTSGIIHFVAPIGVFSLIVTLVGTTGLASFKALGLYALVLFIGLSIHLFLTLPLVLKFLGGINPLVHFKNMVDPMFMAFSTSSSGATLPVTINAVKNKIGVSNRVTSFVLPMGATVNMDGTALYECAGALFIAQVMGVSMGFDQQILIVMTSLLASIGAAAVPSAGLVVIFIVLEAINLTGPQVALIVGAMLAIDRPLDMYRTVVNVVSDSCGAVIIARSEGEKDVDTVVRPTDPRPDNSRSQPGSAGHRPQPS